MTQPSTCNRRAGTGPPAKVRLAIVSELDLHGRGIQSMIDSSSQIETVGVAVPDGLVGYRLRLMQPSVVLIDADEEATVLAALRIRSEMPAVRVAALVPKFDLVVVRCAQAGIVGFVSGESSPSDLEEAILLVSERGSCCPEAVMNVLLQHLAYQALENPVLGKLTPREREILSLLSQDLSNDEIATRLSIERATAKNHVHNILEKLQVRSRREAASAWRDSETHAVSRLFNSAQVRPYGAER